jgi:hypothetical protein
MDHPSLAGLSFNATVYCCLSLLNLDFILTPSLYPDPTITMPMLACPVFPMPPITIDLWHRQFSHLGQDATQDMLSMDFAPGITLPVPLDKVITKCIPCLIREFAQAPYQNNARRASEVCSGPFPTPTPRKEQYFTIFLDDAANFGHTKLLVNKSDLYPAYEKVEASWKLKSGKCVKVICFDGAKEFTQGPFHEHLIACGIAIQVTAPYAHS